MVKKPKPTTEQPPAQEPTLQEFLQTLLALQNASQENLELLLKFIQPSLQHEYDKGAGLRSSNSKKIAASLRQDMLFGDGSTSPEVLAHITSTMNMILQGLYKQNDFRKQLLLEVESVKLKESLVTGKNLPKTDALKYNKAVNNILTKVNTMSERLSTTLGVKFSLLHGKKFITTSAAELLRVKSQMASVLDETNKTNAQLKDLQKGTAAGPAATDEEPEVKRSLHSTPKPKPKGF
jgi:hypothetical protein